MNTYKKIFALLILAQFTICSAQQKKSDFVIGDKISFESKVLNERRTIVVIPPYNYKDIPDEKFPVVYVLDPGNNLFATFGIVNYYSDMLKIIPRMIIVGIVSNDREKDYLPFMLWKTSLTYSTHLYALTLVYGTKINPASRNYPTFLKII